MCLTWSVIWVLADDDDFYIIKICREHKTYVIFSAVRPQPRAILQKAGIHKNLDGAIAADFEHALDMAKQLLADPEFMNKHVDPTLAK